MRVRCTGSNCTGLYTPYRYLYTAQAHTAQAHTAHAYTLHRPRCTGMCMTEQVCICLEELNAGIVWQEKALCLSIAERFGSSLADS